MYNVGLLLSRVALGAGIAAHGAQKAFGAFEGPGPDGAAQFIASLGFSPGEPFATAASWTELTSGTLIALGFGGPIGPAALISTMVVAQTTVHAKNGFFAQSNGVELGVIYSAGALALASAGYGKLSLDEAFGWQKLRHPWFTALAVGAGVVAGLLVLAQRVEPVAGPAPDSAPVRDLPPQANNGESLATAQGHIAAAADDRPVPADLLTAGDGDAAPQG